MRPRHLKPKWAGSIGWYLPEAPRRRREPLLVRVIGEHPHRFSGFGSVPLGLSHQETGKWIEDQVIKNRCLGIGEITVSSGSVDSLSTIFGLARDFGNLPLWVHTFAPLQLSDIRGLVRFAKTYPSVPLILGHLGGLSWLEAVNLAKAHKNVYLDLSAPFTRFAPMFAVRELPDRTLFSSDYPYGDPYTLKVGLDRVIRDDAVLERVMGGNILSLLAGRPT